MSLLIGRYRGLSMSKTSQRELSSYQLGKERALVHLKHHSNEAYFLSSKYPASFRRGWNEEMKKLKGVK